MLRCDRCAKPGHKVPGGLPEGWDTHPCGDLLCDECVELLLKRRDDYGEPPIHTFELGDDDA